jgi:ssDNA-binding Zn-finger/Zn-ribbon topoisomerase 1
MGRPRKPIDPNLCPQGQEKEFQKQVCQLLDSKGIYWEVDPTYRFMACNGRPDIRFCYLGKFCAIECKTAKGNLTPAQFKALEKIRESGGYTTVARGMGEVEQFLSKIENETRN